MRRMPLICTNSRCTSRKLPPVIPHDRDHGLGVREVRVVEAKAELTPSPGQDKRQLIVLVEVGTNAPSRPD